MEKSSKQLCHIHEGPLSSTDITEKSLKGDSNKQKASECAKPRTSTKLQSHKHDVMKQSKEQMLGNRILHIPLFAVSKL